MKPTLFVRLEIEKNEALARNELFSEITANADEIEAAKEWCRDNIWNTFSGDCGGVFMWDGVKIVRD